MGVGSSAGPQPQPRSTGVRNLARQQCDALVPTAFLVSLMSPDRRRRERVVTAFPLDVDDRQVTIFE
jgi:hypothetical protein